MICVLELYDVYVKLPWPNPSTFLSSFGESIFNELHVAAEEIALEIHDCCRVPLSGLNIFTIDSHIDPLLLLLRPESIGYRYVPFSFSQKHKSALVSYIDVDDLCPIMSTLSQRTSSD